RRLICAVPGLLEGARGAGEGTGGRLDRGGRGGGGGGEGAKVGYAPRSRSACLGPAAGPADPGRDQLLWASCLHPAYCQRPSRRPLAAPDLSDAASRLAGSAEDAAAGVRALVRTRSEEGVWLNRGTRPRALTAPRATPLFGWE